MKRLLPLLRLPWGHLKAFAPFLNELISQQFRKDKRRVFREIKPACKSSYSELSPSLERQGERERESNNRFQYERTQFYVTGPRDIARKQVTAMCEPHCPVTYFITYLGCDETSQQSAVVNVFRSVLFCQSVCRCETSLLQSEFLRP
jgi:hypothetical protein